MPHDWIFDVLRDLKAYAQLNGLPALAAKADEALRIARAEVAALPEGSDTGPDAESGGGFSPLGRQH